MTWLIHMWERATWWDVTYLRVGHDSFVCVPWLICDSFVCMIWLICIYDMTHSYVGKGPMVRRDLFVCRAWLFCVYAMTYLYVKHDSSIYGKGAYRETWLVCAHMTCQWLIHVWGKKKSHRDTWQICIKYMTWLIFDEYSVFLGHVIHLVGWIPLFKKNWYGLFCRALLQKRPIILSILLTNATPYHAPHPNLHALQPPGGLLKMYKHKVTKINKRQFKQKWSLTLLSSLVCCPSAAP